MEFNDGVMDPFEAAHEAAWQEWMDDVAPEDDFLALDPRNFDTREWDGEDE